MAQRIHDDGRRWCLADLQRLVVRRKGFEPDESAKAELPHLPVQQLDGFDERQLVAVNRDEIALLEAERELLRRVICAASGPLVGIFRDAESLRITQRAVLELPAPQVFVAAQLALGHDGQPGRGQLFRLFLARDDGMGIGTPESSGEAEAPDAVVEPRQAVLRQVGRVQQQVRTHAFGVVRDQPRDDRTRERAADREHAHIRCVSADGGLDAFFDKCLAAV